MNNENISIKNRSLLNITLWVGSFISPFLFTGLNNILPTIALQFNASAISISLVVLLFAFSQCLFGTIGGRMADLFGLKIMMEIGFFICAVTLLGIFFSESFFIIAVFRLIQGGGTALLLCCSAAIAIKINPIEKRGAVLGMLMAASYLGISLGPIIAGALTTYLGWRLFFLIIFILSITFAIIFKFVINEKWHNAENEKFDAKGAVLFGLSLGCISLGAGLFSLCFQVVFLIPLGFIFLYFFIKEQKAAKFPIINMTMFKHKNFSLGIVAMIINFASTSSIIYFVSMYFQQVRGLSAFVTGAFFLCNSIPQFIMAPIAGRISDKVHPEFILIIGLVLTGFCLANVAFFDMETNLIYIGFILFTIGIAVSTFSAPCAVSILRGVDDKYIGVATGLSATSRVTGLLSAQIIISFIITYFLGNLSVTNETSPLFLKSMQTSLLTFFVFNIICIVLYAFYSLQIYKEDHPSTK